MNKIVGFVICLTILLKGVCTYGQIITNNTKAEIDSLIGVVQNFEGTELVDHFNLVATSISQRYPDSCLHFARQALEIADSLNYEFGEAEAIFNIGNGYFYKFDLKNALTNYLAALRILEKFEALDVHGNLLLQIGFINTFVGNHEKSLDYYRKAQLVFNRSGNQYAELFARRKIGTAFRQMNEIDSALFYFNEILHKYRQIGHKKYEAYVMNDIGVTINEENPNEALPYYENSLNIMREIGYSYGIAVRLQNVGTLYEYLLSEPDLQKAETYYLESILEYERICRFDGAADVSSILGDMYLYIGESEKAKYVLEKGLTNINLFYASIDTMVYEDPAKKFREYVTAKEALAWIYNGLERAFEKEGDYKKAHYYGKLKVQAEDSVYSDANRRLTDVILANAENESVTQKIEILEKEKELQEERAQRSFQLLIGSGVLIVLIILIAVLFIRLKRFRIEKEKTSLQQKLLRSQMNPHFIFNSLSSIQGYITEKDPRSANKYLSKFAKLMRNILDNSVEEYISLEDEIATIENYLELQKVRFEGKFEYTLEVDEAIDIETTNIPPMLAQPFIENSIEHGFKHKKGKGLMRIHFGLKNNLIRFEVSDNGIGREKAKKILLEQNKDHRSLATDITRNRLTILNKKLKKKITLEIIDLKDETGLGIGTTVVFEIPFIS